MRSRVFVWAGLVLVGVRMAGAQAPVTGTEGPAGAMDRPESGLTEPDRPGRERAVFVNPVYEGADPWVVRHGGHYYFCETEGHDGISVWKSDRLTDKGAKRVVWRPEPDAWNHSQIWAPELHRLDGRWYIYYAGSDGRNETHRTGVLAALTDDPQGPYEEKGPLYTGDDIEGRTDNRWSIDATPLELRGRLYLIWSGWPTTEDVQYLYIAPMRDPWTVAGNRVKLCDNATYRWERVSESEQERGLNEAPQVLRRHGRVFVIYSCSGSWEPTYKLAMLYMDEEDDPLDPASWTKHDRPVFESTEDVFGVGHASYTVSPDGSEEWMVFHAKLSREPGWRRAVWLQPFGWSEDGFPDFGKPISAGRPLPVPSGEPMKVPGESFRETFEDGTWDRWVYYGHNRYIQVAEGRLSLGGRPGRGAVNLFRAGEKALVRGREWDDFSMRVRVRVADGDRDAGVLFRVREPALGYDAQKGYFAGIIPGTRKVVLGSMDGQAWHEMALVDHPVAAGRWHELRVEARGERIRVLVDGEPCIDMTDARHARGLVGVRVVDTHGEFDEVEVARLTRP